MLLAVLLTLAPPVEVQRPHDEPPTLALRWSAADSSACPSRAEVIDRIAEQGLAGQLGEWIPERHANAGLKVVVEVMTERDRWRAELTLTGGDGRSQRSFTASSCAALADATALIVAVTLDPVAVATQLRAGPDATTPELEPQPEPEPEPEPLPKPDPEPRVIDASPASIAPLDLNVSASSGEADDEGRWPADLRVGLSVHGGGGWGPTQTGYASLGGRVALIGPRWRATLGGRWSMPRQIQREGAVGSFDAWVVEARACFVAKAGRALEFPLCPGVELGSVRGRGLPPTSNPDSRSFLWVGPSLSQGFSWAPVERFAIGVELGLVAPLTRGRFVVGTAELDRLTAIGARGLVNLELRLP